MKTQTTVCPKCAKRYPCPAFMVGKQIKCECGQEFKAEYLPEDEPAKASRKEAEIPYNGKIHPDSASVVDDQARVLFDYYKAVAERIISEEDRINAEIKTNETAKAAAEAKVAGSKTKVIIFAVIGGLCLLPLVLKAYFFLLVTAAMGILVLTTLNDKKKALEEIVRIEGILTNLRSDFKAIKRDYQVEKMGVAYVPVASRIPFEDRSFILDHTEAAPQKEFSLYMLKDQAGFVESVRTIDSMLDQVPLVEGESAVEKLNTTRLSKSLESVTYYDYIGGLDRNMRAAAFQIGDQDKISVALPIIMPGSELVRTLTEFGTEEIGRAKVVPVFKTTAYDDHLKRFMELNELRRSLAAESRDFERFLEELVQRVASQVQLLSQLKLRTTAGLINYSNNLLLQGFKASYNHYSQELEAEEIERIKTEDFDYQESADAYKPFNLRPSSRMTFDLHSKNWVAEDGSRSNFPFGVHQIQEEIIAPIVEALLKETKQERTSIYDNVKAQKLDYLNQWHRDVDDFYGRGREEANQIMLSMQGTITDLTTAISQFRAFEGAEKGMAAGDVDAAIVKEDAAAAMMSISACESHVQQIRGEEASFKEFMQRLSEDIYRRSGLFGHVRYYDAALRDELAHDIAAASDRIPGMDPRRHLLLKVNAMVADRAKLPPVPDIDQQVQQDLGIDLSGYASSVMKEVGAAAPTAAETATPVS